MRDVTKTPKTKRPPFMLYPWYPWNWVDNLTIIKRGLKFCWQRIMNGYSDYDCYSLDHWFLTVFPDMLRDMRENLHGYPNDMTYDEWVAYLLEMEMHFRKANSEFCTSKKTELKKGFDMMRKRMIDLWD